MNSKTLEKAIEESSFSMHKNYITSLIQPSVDIVKVTSKINIASSKLGGIPDVPSNFKWPTHPYGDYRFVAQFNLKEISQPFPHLPQQGLLSIFIADDEDGNFFWGDDGYAKVYFFESENELQPLTNPNFSDQPCIPVKLEASIDIPFREELLENNPLNNEQIEELVYEVIEKTDKKYNHLLGYPFYSSLAYDPRPDNNWTSLLTLSSIDELDWCWHDGDFLMLFIEKDKLIQQDFSNIKSDAG
ncbi:YwqG family protein [Tenacibaculum agarivorans]|uniref:YwqG family protein n=1 Tax=Tenacibaculum agarivorans TaxID=1908389 RepID=UPI0009F8B192|nr:YwqG family protein [Tenacibaculum agarivorans]